MSNVYLVVGNPGVGKSTTIRILTGVKSSRDGIECDIQTANGKERFLVFSMSLNEINMLADTFMKKCRKHKNILIALRTNKKAHKGNRYIDYIIAFRKNKWSIPKKVVVLSSKKEEISIRASSKNIKGLSILHILPKSIPANAIAAKVRKAWKWK